VVIVICSIITRLVVATYLIFRYQANYADWKEFGRICLRQRLVRSQEVDPERSHGKILYACVYLSLSIREEFVHGCGVNTIRSRDFHSLSGDGSRQVQPKGLKQAGEGLAETYRESTDRD
jgi:hypothetical protein